MFFPWNELAFAKVHDASTFQHANRGKAEASRQARTAHRSAHPPGERVECTRRQSRPLSRECSSFPGEGPVIRGCMVTQIAAVAIASRHVTAAQVQGAELSSPCGSPPDGSWRPANRL